MDVKQTTETLSEFDKQNIVDALNLLQVSFVWSCTIQGKAYWAEVCSNLVKLAK